MKVRILIVAGAAAVLSGCWTEQMKSTPFYEGHDVTYTGREEDRVNLWPLAYWREPVGSVLWPMLSFSDDHFAFRPVYSRYKDEHNFLWPIGQYDTGSNKGRFFPVFWGEHYFHVFPLVWNDRDFHSLFPLFYYEEKDYMILFPIVWWGIEEKSFTLFPLFGHSPESDWVLPLFYRDKDVTMITPFCGANKEGSSWFLPFYWHDNDVTWISPFFGMNKYGDSWLIPLYASISGDFLSPLWCGGSHDKGKEYSSSWWFAPPLLSWGSEVKGMRDDRYLLGLGGYSGGEASSSSWLMPFYYGNSEGTFVTPLYGQTKDSSWTFPVWYRDNDSFASWFWGGHWNDKDELDWWIVPPLLTSGGRDENGARFSVLTVLGGAHWDGPDGFRSSWCFPLWYENSTGTLVTPLYGQYDGCRWLAPLFYKDKFDFVTPLWWQSFNAGTGDTESWMIPPLLTGGGKNGDGSTYFYSPIGGYSGEKSGMFPLWYKDEDSFASILFSKWRWNGDANTTYFVPPLLSWYTSRHKYGGSETRLLLGLYGHDTSSKGEAIADWLFPLYSWRDWDDWKLLGGISGMKSDGSNWLFPLYGYEGGAGDLQTILFGRESHHSHTNYWYFTPLVGNTTGDESGFWFQPFVHWSRDNDIGDLERMMNADRLDDSIVGKKRTETKWNSEKRQYDTNEVFRTESASAVEKLRFCLDILGRNRTIHVEGGDNEERYRQWLREEAREAAGKQWREGKERTVSFDEKTEFGNVFVGGESRRVVNFDYDTKEKVFDGELDESQALFGFLWSSRDEKIAGGHEYSKRAVLWRLWHYEKLDGDSTTDIFPFITHDTKKNGYSKTSFLWRFFNYEHDPDKGTSVDLFFIPVWRP